MNEGEVRFVVKAYDHNGTFLDDFSFIAEDKQDIFENDDPVVDFMVNILETRGLHGGIAD